MYSHTVAFTIRDYQENSYTWALETLAKISQESTTIYKNLDNSFCIDHYINCLNSEKNVIVIVDKSSSLNDNSTLLGHFEVD